MGPGFMGPPGRDPMKLNEKLKEPKPKTLREVPGYLWRVLKSTTARMRYIFQLVWETKHWILFLMLFASIYNGVSPVISAYISANLLNKLAIDIQNHTLDLAISALLIQFGYLIINSLWGTVYNILYRISGELITNNIKVKIMKKAKEVDISSFDKPEFYERLENANREAGMRPLQMLNSTFSIISTMISMVSFIAVMAAVLPYAPVLIIAISIPSAIVNFHFRKKNFHYMRFRSIDRRQMNYYSELLVNKDMVKEIRLFGLADRFVAGYSKVFQKYFGGIKKLIYEEGIWNFLITILSTGVNCFLYIMIAKSIIEGDGLIGNFSLFTGALGSISGGVASLISTSATIYEGSLFIDNLLAFMNEKKTIVPLLAENTSDAQNLPVARGRSVSRHCGHTIRLEHVYFRYPGTERDVLHDINLTLTAGDTCVLVGLNGAGKTTLIKLLTRLYDPTSGTVYLDGHDIREYNVEELYAMFGIIFQDFGKYAFSVTDNIVFGDISREADASQVKDAAERSAADVFIEKLPLKYDTPLMRFFSEDGIELSIGQWQKLSIARAFYSDSDFLILDEPTASLDAIAEQEVFKQFDELRKDKTTVFVSHRLSSATVASKIIVLENGCLVEEGNHQELMNARGKYYQLFSTQAKRYITTADEGLIGDTELVDHAPKQSGMGGIRAGEASRRSDGGAIRFGERPPFGGKPPFGDRPPFGDKAPHDGKPPIDPSDHDRQERKDHGGNP